LAINNFSPHEDNITAATTSILLATLISYLLLGRRKKAGLISTIKPAFCQLINSGNRR